MNKIAKGETPLLGLILPYKRQKMSEYLDQWRFFLCDPIKSAPFEEWVYLEFDFRKHKKRVVHRDIARAIAEKWTKLNESEFARYMALYSNLSDNPDYEKRCDAIRRGISRQMKYFKPKSNETN